MSSSDIKDFPLGVSGFHFSDLYKPTRLKDLHAEFWKTVNQQAPDVPARFKSVGTSSVTKPQESEILIEVAQLLGGFISRLFNVTSHVARVKNLTTELAPVFRLKRDFLNLRVFKRFEEPAASEIAFKEIDDRVKKIFSHESSLSADDEAAFAAVVVFLVNCEKKLKAATLEPAEIHRLTHLLSHLPGTSLEEKTQLALKYLEDWCVQVWVEPARRKRVAHWASYLRPKKLDFENLVHVDHPVNDLPELMTGPEDKLRPRDGFKLTDSRLGPKEILREVDYCIYCHQREKDSCSKGFHEKDGSPKKNPLGIRLLGCPLDERISEMHWLKKQGEIIGSLAMIMLDNPMCPGTGHRICNDCMKGCIFQKQDPVNIPANETAVLSDVLNLPYGFEIYSLLTRFNPLNKERPYALPYNGNDVLVVGLGPAGYTLSHYLSNLGFGVVGIDGLKLEPVDNTLTGRARAFPKPIQNYNDLKKELDERVLMGFGGVSEYGITVRWDKNFLSIIYLSLLRRKNVRLYGGVRFGGTLTLDDAWELGFKHVAIATGAGRPTIINLKNNLIRGIRKASDFLMALQLTGAFKRNSLANLQVRLPAVVIGGGLTAIDTATELLAYYPVQVEKILERHETLVREYGEENATRAYDEEEKEILSTFLVHGKAIRDERRAAEKEKRKPNFIPLCRAWGGVTIAYRKRLIESPAYRLNHEEVEKAMEEGIAFAERLNPVEAVPDRFGAVEALKMQRSSGEYMELPARSVCIAAGTSPNTIYEKEFPGTFEMDERKSYFKKFTAAHSDSKSWKLREAKPGDAGAFFLSYENKGRFVTFYGDNHPDYAGNVVKAMASAKHGAPHVAKLFKEDIQKAENSGGDISRFESLISSLDESLIPRVVKVQRLTPTIVEVIVRARFASRKFEPGQFYRLQNYETSAHSTQGQRLTMEGLALTGAWVDKEKDLLSLIVLEMGGSSRLCALLEPNEPIVVMGPTGTPSEIPSDETVCLVGGGLGNAVLLSIAKALKENNNRVIYFAGYRNAHDRFKQTEIESVTDQVVWAVDSGEPLSVNREGDLSFVGNIVQAMASYAKGELGGTPRFPFNSVDRMIVIGSDKMMAAVQSARHGILEPYLKRDHLAIASINSPMQCMMKEVCAQCLQKHIDPKTGEERVVFSCYNQDQCMDEVDFKNLNERLRMNSAAEKLADQWLNHLLRGARIERI